MTTTNPIKKSQKRITKKSVKERIYLVKYKGLSRSIKDPIELVPEFAVESIIWNSELGNKLKQLRISCKITQRLLAREMKYIDPTVPKYVSQAYISRLESGYAKKGKNPAQFVEKISYNEIRLILYILNTKFNDFAKENINHFLVK